MISLYQLYNLNSFILLIFQYALEGHRKLIILKIKLIFNIIIIFVMKHETTILIFQRNALFVALRPAQAITQRQVCDCWRPAVGNITLQIKQHLEELS